MKFKSMNKQDYFLFLCSATLLLFSFSASASNGAELLGSMLTHVEEKPTDTALIAALIAAGAAIITPLIAWALNTQFENREMTKVDYLVKQTELMNQLLAVKACYQQETPNGDNEQKIAELDQRINFTHNHLVTSSVCVEVESQLDQQISLSQMTRSEIAFLLFRPNAAAGWLLAFMFAFILLLIASSLVLSIYAENELFPLFVLGYGMILRSIHRGAI